MRNTYTLKRSVCSGGGAAAIDSGWKENAIVLLNDDGQTECIANACVPVHF